MKNDIIAIIKKESQYKPLTDAKIGEQLSLGRDVVGEARKEMGIPDSRERLRINIINYIRKDREKYQNLTERMLTQKLNTVGFQISRYVVREIKKEIEAEDKTKSTFIIESKKKKVKIEEDFSELVGYDRSLGPIIKQAKAAILYPPKGLHTLILGETGVGKSNLAVSMFHFAQKSKVIKKDAEMVVFNCADYAENPELLMAQIFGYTKGAFTGADKDKAGLVEQAHNSILFLDEIHRLPPEGQEQLFYLIDKGKFRRLGETDSERKIDLMIIAATTENPEETLLSTFRRRIPMVIEIPSLKERSISEKLDIIKKFIQLESIRTLKKIKINNNALKALLLFDCPGNLGQLQSEIQVACAKSFLNIVAKKEELLIVSTIELSDQVRRGLMNIKYFREELERTIGDVDVVIYADDDISNRRTVEYTHTDEIYTFIEERYDELQERYDNQEIINQIIDTEIDKRLKTFVKDAEIEHKKLNKEEISNIFGEEMFLLVDRIVQLASACFNINMENLKYVFAAHFTATIDRVIKGRKIKNPQLNKIQENYPKEFKVALQVIELIEQEMDIYLPIDEAAFIASYFRMAVDAYNEKEQATIAVLVISHGGAASAMIEVANALLGLKYAYSVEMALDEKPQSALERTEEMVKKIDMGKGVLLLVDMGSLVTFGDIISEKTGIQTRTIPRVDTVLIIDAIRRAMLPDSQIDEIADSLLESGKNSPINLNNRVKSKKKNLIITLCLTGEGSGNYLKELLLKKLNNDHLVIFALGVFEEIGLNNKIKELAEKYHIICAVGTVNPKISGIRFIKMEDVVLGKGIDRIQKLLQDTKDDHLELDEKIIFTQLSLTDKDEIIRFMFEKMCENGYLKVPYYESIQERQKIGFFDMLDETENGIAVIHSAAFEEVNKNGLGIMILEKPIFWDRIMVDIIFLLAVKEDSIDIPTQFHTQFVKNAEMMKLLRMVDKAKEVLTLI